MSDLIIENKYNYKNRYINDPIFTPIIPKEYELNEPVIVYYNGIKYKIIPQKFMMKFPIIYDKYYTSDITSSSNTRVIKPNTGYTSDITVSYCPYTASSIIYFEKYVLTNKIFNSNIILQNMDDNNKLIVQLSGLSLYKSTNDFIQRGEIKIMTLRNAISKYPDSSFLDISKYKKKELLKQSYNINNEILYPLLYNSSEYHPKTLIYGIDYISKKDSGAKYSAIVSKDASKNKVNNIDIIKNGYDIYFNKMMENIREKGGVVIPCFWFAWYAMHPETRIIKL